MPEIESAGSSRPPMSMGGLLAALLGGAVTTSIGGIVCADGLQNGTLSFVLAALVFLSGLAGIALAFLARRKRAASVALLGVGVLAFVLLALLLVSTTITDGDFVLGAYLRFLWPPLLMIIPGALGARTGHTQPGEDVEAPDTPEQDKDR
jgi:hypothetical protein